MIAWMVYTVVMGGMVALAARALEPAWGGGRRFLWAGALLVASLWSFVADPVVAWWAGWGGSGGVEVLFGPIRPVAAPAMEFAVSAGRAVTLPSLDAALTAAWLAATVTLLARTAAAILWSWRTRRSWTRARVDGVGVWVSEMVGPAVVGVVRPEIVVPSWVTDLPPVERAMVLAHEEEHRRRGDPALLAGAFMLVVAMPWNPVLWWALSRLRDAVETDCDARVVSKKLGETACYARLLVDVGDRTRSAGPRSPVPLGAGFGERRSSLERRIAAMLDGTAGPGWKKVGMGMALAVLVLAGACTLEVNLELGNDDEEAQAAEFDARRVTRAVAPTATAEVREVAGGAAVQEVAGGAAVQERPTRVAVPAAPPFQAAEGRVVTREDLANAPTFTPFTAAPSILNRGEVVEAMVAEYPPLLRSAGIGGTVKMSFFIDEEGRVGATRIKTSSGNRALDEAALRVADSYRFSPALNRDQKVPVWVVFPITFQMKDEG